MNPEEILEHVRKLIAEHAGNDPDEWWYANRYVFARLNLDERKTKTDVKARLFGRNSPCHHCGKPFAARKGVHLHRLDNLKGYRDDNCVLMHDDCHEEYHRLHPPKHRQPSGRKPGGKNKVRVAGRPRTGQGVWRREVRGPADSVLVKQSQPYRGTFLYWWDVSPGLAEDLGGFEAVEFVCKDTGASCTIPVSEIRKCLTPDRQTTRGDGNWGIKVLRDRPDELAFESGRAGGGWLFLPVVWVDEAAED